MKKLLLCLSICVVFLCISPQTVFGATPTVTTVIPNKSSVGKYEKYEVTFQINKVFPDNSFLPYYFYDANDTPANFPNRQSPYGVDGITIDAIITSPSNKTITLPAFYYQDYVRTRGGNDEVMTPQNTRAWKLRFTPEEVGTYQYYIRIRDKEGTTRYPENSTLNFASVASNSPGFIRTSARDSRFLEYQNGKSFIPIGSGRQWWKCCGKRSYDYDDTFDIFGAHGINFTRIWDQNDGYALTIEGHFDAYKYPDDYNPTDRGVDINALPKGTQINQRGAYQLDKIIEAAERNKIAMVISQHEDPYWIWDVPRNAYDNNVPYTNYWKRAYRYRIARWGYSTSVLAWERWNEHGHLPQNSAVFNWYLSFAQWMREADPFAHLFTTSQGSQSYSPAFYSSAAADYTSYHDYLMAGRYSASLEGDTTNFLYRAAQCIRTPGISGCFMGDGSAWSGSQKPIYFGEFDSGTTQWNQANPHPLVQHNGLWAGLFSVAGSSPLDWYWDQQTYATQKYQDAKIASQFFADIDYAGSQFTHMATSDIALNVPTISTTQEKMRALALRPKVANAVYVWVQHKDHRWKGVPNPTPVSGSLTIPGMVVGNYTMETWNTTSGAKTTSAATVASNGILTIPVTNLSSDVAIKVRLSNYQPPPSPSPTPPISIIPTNTPAVTVAPASCPTDINQDEITDLSDYSILVSHFLQTSPSNQRADINDDGIVDLSDYSLLVLHFLEVCE